MESAARGTPPRRQTNVTLSAGGHSPLPHRMFMRLKGTDCQLNISQRRTPLSLCQPAIDPWSGSPTVRPDFTCESRGRQQGALAAWPIA